MSSRLNGTLVMIIMKYAILIYGDTRKSYKKKASP